MDQIFDRLGNLLKTFLQEDPDQDTGKTSFSDPDLQDAWDELDDFMRTGETTGSGETKERVDTPPPPRIPVELKKDYRIFNVRFGAPLSEVAKSYKTLLRKHHPDRHASNPSDFAKATEITKQLTSSFRRIRQYEETGKVG